MLIQIYHQLEPLFNVLGVTAFLLICSVSVTAFFVFLVKTFWKVFMGIGVVATLIVLGVLIIPGL